VGLAVNERGADGAAMAYKEIGIPKSHKTKAGNVITNPKISTTCPTAVPFYEADRKLVPCQNIHKSETFVSATATLGGADTTIYRSNKRKERA